MDSFDPKPILKAVGRGKTLSRNLSGAEMTTAMEALLSGAFTPTQVGAFLQALRIKETTADEVAGALAACGNLMPVSGPMPERLPLVVNVAFDSKRKPTVLSVLAAHFLARHGLCSPCLVWSPCLNAGLADPLAESLAHCERTQGLQASVPVLSVDDLLPRLATLAGLRRELGFRTILNTLEKLLRPWKEAPVALGIAHDNFLERLALVLHRDGSPHGAIVKGNHGTCDLGLGQEPTQVLRYRGDVLENLEVGASRFPWQASSSVHLIASRDRWAEWLQDRESPLWNAIRCQASFLLWMASPALSLDDCIAQVGAAN